MIFNNPKTFKDGELIMGQFRIYDLVLLGLGFVISLLLIILVVNLGIQKIMVTFILVAFSLLPGLFAFGLVAKKNGFHNYLEFFKVLIYFHTKYIKHYRWEGVVLSDEID